MNNEDSMRFFEENYKVIARGNFSRGEKHLISTGKSRTCRFCCESEPKTTFKNESHAIPECLGNHQLILLDECDACNKYFSENLEDHLDKYTKPYRIAGQIMGKRGIPSYKSKNKKNRIDFDGTPTVKTEAGENFFTVDHEARTITINFHQEPHIPLAVYKSLVKIAISVIEDENELTAFALTSYWLLHARGSYSIISPAILMETFIPGPRPIEGVSFTLFRKKAEELNVPYAIFVIGFGNIVFQIIVPSMHDMEKSITLEMPFMPIGTLFDESKYGSPKQQYRDVSGAEKTSSDFPITFNFDQMIKISQENFEEQ